MKEISVKIFYKKLDEIEKDLTNIFNEVTSGKTPLKRRIELRKESLRISLDLLRTLKECIILGKKELKKDKIINTLDIVVIGVLTFGSVALFFFNPLFSLLALSFSILKNFTKLKKLKNEINESCILT